MKKVILLINLLCLPLIFLAQTQKPHSAEKLNQKKLEVKAAKQNNSGKLVEGKPTAQNYGNLPTVVAGSAQYHTLKAQNKLSQYSVIADKNEVVMLQAPVNNSSAKVAALTPCDFPPFVGTNPYLPSTVAIDDAGRVINLPFTFCFYGVNYTSMRVFDNGNVQFATNSVAFTSTGFPSTVVNMVAPFWGDGKLNNLVGGLRYGKVLVDLSTPSRVVVSWDSLPYFQATVTDVSKLNRFQLVLTDGLDPILPTGKNVGFYYTQMQWTTGNASGGLNGFPGTQPGNPSTVGANLGNGTDYFQMGRFGVPGIAYDGPQGNNDGVSWLNGKKFFFDLCPGAGTNFEPVSALLGYCDTVKVCGNDTIYVKNTFLAPEIGQIVTVTATAPTLGAAFSYSTFTNPNGGTDIYVIVDGNLATGGYHTINIAATDNGVPALTNGQQLIIYVNQASVSSLNGGIVITPTVGACPGGIVAASISVTGGAVDSYLWSNGLGGSSTTFTTVVASDSLIFVTLKSGQCSKTIVGDININPTPVASISGNLSFCNGNASVTVLTATNTLNPATQGPHTYSWTGTGSSASYNGATASVNAGVYTVTVTNQFGCKSVATTTVVVNDSPKYTLNSTNAVSGGSVYCANQDTARIAISFGSGSPASCGLATAPCVISNSVQIGTATTQGSASDYTPFNGLWESAKHQYLIRASELLNAGVLPGKLTSLSFGITNLNGNANIFRNFYIKLKCVSNNVVGPTLDNSGLVQVFGPATVTVTPGINTYNFTQAYLWDGTSNLLVDVCWFNNLNEWDGNISVQYTNVGYNASFAGYGDIIDHCQAAPTNTAISQNRPNMAFGNCLGQQTGSQFNVSVTPSTGVVIPANNNSIKIDLPSTAGTTCYTVSLVNPIGNCVKDTVICLNVTQGVTQATLAASSASVCPSTTVTLSAVGAVDSYTISYTNAGGLQTSVNAPVTFTPLSAIGAYVYTLSAVGPCGGPLTDFTTTVNVIQGVTQATLVASSDSICPNTPVTLTAAGAVDSYTISYTDAGGLQTSVNAPVTFTPLSATGAYVYTLSAVGPCSGPLTDFTTTVNVIQGVTNATLVATPSVVCIGQPITLTANGSSLATYTITYNNGTLINSVNNAAIFNSAIAGVNVYTLTAQGLCSAPVRSFTASVLVNNLSNLSIAPIPDVIKCINGTVTLTANVAPSASAPYTYNWSPAAVGTNTNSTFVTSAPVTTTFVVTVNGFCANTATASVVVRNYANDINVTILDSASLCANTELKLNSTTSGGKTPYTYNWTILPDINTISTSPALNTTSPASSGNYSVMIVSTDSCGFTDFDIQIIEVLPPCGIEIGNVITPNGDGANEYFKIKNIEYHPNSTLTIFDRWGKKVFESPNYANEWRAEGLNDGTFFYTLDVPDDKKYSGFVQVIR